MLLKRLYVKLSEKATENIKSGFNKCGIIAFNRNRVLNMIPSDSCDTMEDDSVGAPAQALNDSIREFLQNMKSNQPKPRIPRKRLAVEPGKSVKTVSDNNDLDEPRESNHVSSPNSSDTSEETVEETIKISSVVVKHSKTLYQSMRKRKFLLMTGY